MHSCMTNSCAILEPFLFCCFIRCLTCLFWFYMLCSLHLAGIGNLMCYFCLLDIKLKLLIEGPQQSWFVCSITFFFFFFSIIDFFLITLVLKHFVAVMVSLNLNFGWYLNPHRYFISSLFIDLSVLFLDTY